MISLLRLKLFERILKVASNILIDSDCGLPIVYAGLRSCMVSFTWAERIILERNFATGDRLRSNLRTRFGVRSISSLIQEGNSQ